MHSSTFDAGIGYTRSNREERLKRDMLHEEGCTGSAPSDTDVLGMTLAEYAAVQRTHPQRVRQRYAQMMRQGAGLTLPAITRREHQDGVIKFCLPVSEASGASLESESVIIPMHSYRGTNWHTLCISSQVGCRMGCTFCETGRMGLLHNLSAADIVRQRLVARRVLLEHASGPPRSFRYFADGIQNIVFMGMGEPLDNFDNVVQAIRVLNEPAGLNFPLSQITLGFCKTMGIEARVLPMSNDPVRTVVVTEDGHVSYHEYLTELECAPVVKGFMYAGADVARIPDEVLEQLG